MRFSLTKQSSNRKTGPIPVSTSPKITCPEACSLKGKGGCYAGNGPMSIHWKKLGRHQRGMEWDAFLRAVKDLPDGQLFRHNQAGDFIGKCNTINRERLDELVTAAQNKLGWTYTHYPMIDHKENCDAIRNANSRGFTCNLSADNLEQADKLADLDIGPVVTILPSTVTGNCRTPKGKTVVLCPVAANKIESCEKCRLCQKVNRKAIIGFPSHGSYKKRIDKILEK